MNKILNDVIIFATGAAMSGLIVRSLTKNKYEKIVQEEVQSVKEQYKKMNSVKNVENREEDISETSYENVKKVDEEKFEREKPDILKGRHSDEEDEFTPYVITPEEFGDSDEYPVISLSYFLDGVLTDENYEPVENADELIGLDSLNHFGEYEDDAVYVRNDRMKCDFEILLDQRRYQAVMKTIPH